MFSQPPAIFAKPIDDDVVIEKKTKDGKVEKYATFFRYRQAYVGIPITHPWAKQEFTEDILCTKAHGGLTWSESKLNDGLTRDGMWFIGWDYGHYVDMTEMVCGISYGKIYDATSKDIVIATANEVMKEAIDAMPE